MAGASDSGEDRRAIRGGDSARANQGWGFATANTAQAICDFAARSEEVEEEKETSRGVEKTKRSHGTDPGGEDGTKGSEDRGGHRERKGNGGGLCVD